MYRQNDPVPPPFTPQTPQVAVPQAYLDALVPRYPVRMTWVFIAVIVLVYIGEWLNPGLAARFDVNPAAVRQGEWWRLLTGGLLHAGELHLAANAYFGWAIGARIERFIGPWRLLLISLAAQLGCGIAVTFGSTPALGFSGVLYGWLACWLAFHLTPRYPGLRLSGPMRRAYLQTLIANLVISLIPGVSMLGHVGGFVAGFAVAFVMGRKAPPTSAEPSWSFRSP